jgi:hypothetical protein
MAIATANPRNCRLNFVRAKFSRILKDLLADQKGIELGVALNEAVLDEAMKAIMARSVKPSGRAGRSATPC